MVIVIGSYAEPDQAGIHVYELDIDTCEFKLVNQVTGIENPSYFTFSDDQKTLYAVSEIKEGSSGQISIYDMNVDRGDLTLRERMDYEGNGSCYISTDHIERHAFIANYDAGTLVVTRLADANRPMQVAQVQRFYGDGPNPERQKEPHIHSALLLKDKNILYCADLGTDHVYRFHYSADDERPLTPCDPPYLEMPAGSGPRHMAFSSDFNYLYVISELSGEIFGIETSNNRQFQHLNVHAQDYTGKVESADIQIHGNGRFLYASLRGDANEIVCYSINSDTGELTFLQRISCEGISPRSLCVSAQNNILLAANEQSNSVTVFRIKDDGRLVFTGTKIGIDQPACVRSLNS